MVILRDAEDAHFAWMLDGSGTLDALSLPAGGVDSPDILALLRGVAATLRAGHGFGMWLIVHQDEVAGLCGYMNPPRDGAVEIGYGIAPVWRRLGLASKAVAALVTRATQDKLVETLLAETAVANLPSQRVLEHNFFIRIGTRHDPEDGDLLQWRLTLPPA